MGETPNFCPNCGRQIKVGTKFCPKCGFDLISIKMNSTVIDNSQDIRNAIKPQANNKRNNSTGNQSQFNQGSFYLNKIYLVVGTLSLVAGISFLWHEFDTINTTIHKLVPNQSTISQYLKQSNAKMEIIAGLIIALGITFVVLAFIKKNKIKLATGVGLMLILSIISSVTLSSQVDAKYQAATANIALKRIPGSTQVFKLTWQHYWDSLDEVDTEYSNGVFKFKKNGKLNVYYTNGPALNADTKLQETAKMYRQYKNVQPDEKGTWAIRNNKLYMSYDSFDVVSSLYVPYAFNLSTSKHTVNINRKKYDVLSVSQAFPQASVNYNTPDLKNLAQHPKLTITEKSNDDLEDVQVIDTRTKNTVTGKDNDSALNLQLIPISVFNK